MFVLFRKCLGPDTARKSMLTTQEWQRNTLELKRLNRDMFGGKEGGAMLQFCRPSDETHHMLGIIMLTTRPYACMDKWSTLQFPTWELMLGIVMLTTWPSAHMAESSTLRFPTWVIPRGLSSILKYGRFYVWVRIPACTSLIRGVMSCNLPW